MAQFLCLGQLEEEFLVNALRAPRMASVMILYVEGVEAQSPRGQESGPSRPKVYGSSDI